MASISPNLCHLAQQRSPGIASSYQSPAFLSVITATKSPALSVSSSIIQKVEKDAWVQCENPDCLKWRRIPRSEIANLTPDSPWFCFMNPDDSRALCEVPEEGYQLEERVAKRCKMKYVMSVLMPGTLVWAKVSGYCRWPGVVCRDPIPDGLSVIEDHDGEPMHYHIEFLGETHCHGWVVARNVDLFGAKDTEEGEEAGKQRQGQNLQRKRRSRGFSQKPVKPKESQNYRGNTVEYAVDEARSWSHLTPAQRLDKLVYKYSQLLPDPTTMVENSSVAGLCIPTTSAASQQKTRGRPKTKKPKLHHKDNSQNPSSDAVRHVFKTSSLRSAQDCIEDNQLEPNMFTNATKTKSLPVNTTVSSFGQQPATKRHIDKGDVVTGTTNVGSPGWLRSKQQLDEKLNSSASLLKHSKEEKFSLDLESYATNKKCFEEDLERFMSQYGGPQLRTPVWHNAPISLYELFLAVHDRGGYHQVCEDRSWAGLYREFTGTSNPGTGGTMVRKFYKKYLLAYELYISNKEFLHLLRKDTVEVTSRDSPASVPSITNTICRSSPLPGWDNNSDTGMQAPGELSNDAASGTSSYQNVLTVLEDFSQQIRALKSQDKEHYQDKAPVVSSCEDQDLPVLLSPGSRRYREADIGLDFRPVDSDLAGSPGEEQQVPQVSPSQQGSHCDPYPTLLQEMEALQQELALVQREEPAGSQGSGVIGHWPPLKVPEVVMLGKMEV